MASDDWRTSGHGTEAPEAPAPHGAAPEPPSDREEAKREEPPGDRETPSRMLTGWWNDFVRATIFLTRIPLDISDANAARPLAAAGRGFPLVGLVVGVVGALTLLAGDAVGLPELASALLAVAATIAITGGLHEDGLADTADGLMAGRDRESTFAIMRDSRIGTFGTLALIVTVGLKVSSLEAMEPATAAAALIAAEIAGRTALPAVLLMIPAARTDGLGFGAGRPAREEVTLAVLLGGVLTLIMLGMTAGIVAVIAGGGVAALVAQAAKARLGGHTGDILGAVQQSTATTVLLVAASVL